MAKKNRTTQRDKIVEFPELNTAGKAVFIAGSAFRIAENIFDFTLTAMGDIWAQAEKALLEEIAPEISDAVIIEESGDQDKKAE